MLSAVSSDANMLNREVDKVVGNIIKDMQSRNLIFSKRDKMATIISCTISAYGVLLFLAPNYYENNDDSEFWRVWYTVWGLMYNYVLNSYFSVKPLQIFYDELKGCVSVCRKQRSF